METRELISVKLLFENWRRYVNEVGDPDSDADDKEELNHMAGGMTRGMIEKAIEEFSFNSGDERSPKHRWGSGQPIIDYSRAWDDGSPMYTATLPLEDWKEIPSEVGEDFIDFLTRIKERSKQLTLPLQTDPKKEFRDRIRRMGSGQGRTPYADEDLARAKGELT